MSQIAASTLLILPDSIRIHWTQPSSTDLSIFLATNVHQPLHISAPKRNTIQGPDGLHHGRLSGWEGGNASRTSEATSLLQKVSICCSGKAHNKPWETYTLPDLVQVVPERSAKILSLICFSFELCKQLTGDIIDAYDLMLCCESAGCLLETFLLNILDIMFQTLEVVYKPKCSKSFRGGLWFLEFQWKYGWTFRYSHMNFHNE